MSGDIFHCDNTLTETERGRGAAQLSLQHIQYLLFIGPTILDTEH